MGGRGASSKLSATRTPKSRLVISRMSDTELTDLMSEAQKVSLPKNLHDDITQRLIHVLGWNDKPEIVDPSEVEDDVRNGATALYRSLGPNIFGTPAEDIMESILTDDVNSIGGWGGQAYGGGLYFSNSYSGSTAYVSSSDGATIGAVFSSKARPIHETEITGSKGAAFLNKHPSFARAVGAYKRGTTYSVPTSSISAVAMAMGYNVVYRDVGGGEKYYTVIDRSALKTSHKNYFHTGKIS